jgi:hypothetical protein
MNLRVMLWSLLLATGVASAQNYSTIQERQFATAVTTTGTQAWFTTLGKVPQTVTCAMTVTSGSGSATVKFEGAPKKAQTAVITLATLSVTDTAAATYTDATSKFGQYRVEISAITGTGAAVSCYVAS